MPHKFINSITLSSGLVEGAGFSAILDDDLPRVGPAVPGGYTNPTLVVDQYGRITSIVSGSSGGVTNVATGTGLTGGPITTTGTISLADTAVTPGSYTLASITVDQQGRITAASSGSSGGTVTSVSVVTANGVSGSVATATTTPAITLTLGAITPSSIVSAGAISGSNLSGTNTGDQTITLTGDVTGTGVGSFAATIGNTKVTLAKIANAAANSKLLGSGTAGSGASYVELTLGAGLTMTSTTLSSADPITSIYPVFTPAGVDDEFDDGSFSGWTLVNDSTHLVTVTETNNVCSIFVPGSDTAAHLQAFMKSTTVNANDYIEIAFGGWGENSNFHMLGLIMADGTTYGAGNQVVWSYFPSLSNMQMFSHTNYNTQGTNTTKSIGGEITGAMFMRLKYLGSNNWAGFLSCDGISWANFTGTLSRTLTPTKVGFVVSSWGATTEHVWSVKYFRKGP